MGYDLSRKCCKTGKRFQVAQVTAQQPPSEVNLASKRASSSHSDTNGVTCCPGTGETQSHPCRMLLHGFPNMHLRELRWECLPNHPFIPPPFPDPQGFSQQRRARKWNGWGICLRTLNLSLPFTAARQILLSFSHSCTHCCWKIPVALLDTQKAAINGLWAWSYGHSLHAFTYSKAEGTKKGQQKKRNGYIFIFKV